MKLRDAWLRWDGFVHTREKEHYQRGAAGSPVPGMRKRKSSKKMERQCEDGHRVKGHARQEQVARSPTLLVPDPPYRKVLTTLTTKTDNTDY